MKSLTMTELEAELRSWVLSAASTNGEEEEEEEEEEATASSTSFWEERKEFLHAMIVKAATRAMIIRDRRWPEHVTELGATWADAVWLKKAQRGLECLAEMEKRVRNKSLSGEEEDEEGEEEEEEDEVDKLRQRHGRRVTTEDILDTTIAGAILETAWEVQVAMGHLMRRAKETQGRFDREVVGETESIQSKAARAVIAVMESLDRIQWDWCSQVDHLLHMMK